MATCTEIHFKDIGTSFRATLTDCGVVVDISAATTKTLIFTKPTINGVAGDKVEKIAVFPSGGDGTDGVMEYLTILDDLDVLGTWRIQGFVTLPTGSWSTDIQKFKVYENL